MISFKVWIKGNNKDQLIYVMIILTLCFSSAALFAGENSFPSLKSPSGVFRIVFYNVENLFDTVNEPDRNDDAFTPSGERRWNSYRLDNKLNNLYKALAAAGGWRLPSVIGLCEVENKYVLEKLVNETGFAGAGFEIIHRNSADSRGIDVAVLYRSDDFVVLDTLFKVIRFPFDSLATTRDILYVKGIAGAKDTVHFFVNHWTSRWGGQAATEPYRNYTASVLRSLADSVFRINPRASIIIMGDFNDEPEDISLRLYLGARFDYDQSVPGKLYNLSHSKKGKVSGTLKFQGEWFLFDQFIVSGSLMDGRGGLKTCPLSAKIFSADFLLTTDNIWFGYKPFRTYEGFRHTGGFSDHLPVILDLWW